ncbi:YbhB/YbcL family Raf kinase inhibitor-like protein [Halorientalis brevis]|uniref:YbhB/YbcL family Raf kinase inhibitor-like protein n=1 Tax=Halorientalis brevis TaxID=1126241 RepID=A0ABD6CH07_9EURY|nr:YbhB/YbcL family Raf kinase inhibitor-like protein [Halorientalis brevis]
MPGRRDFLVSVSSGTGLLLAGCLDGTDSSEDSTETSPDATNTQTDDTVSTTRSNASGLQLSSTAFEDGGNIPQKYTFDGADVSPPLSISGVPADADSLVLVVDDPDAPNPPFTHWLLWDIPADTTAIPAGIEQSRTAPELDGAKQGTNSFDVLGYRGPRPPKGDGSHTYRFTLTAVERPLNVQAGASRDQIADALQGNSVATARITGEYER